MLLKNRKFPYYFEEEITALSPNVVKSGVEEILKVTQNYIKKPLNSLSVLDGGSGRGEYALEMSKYFKKVVGVEPFKDANDFAIKITSKKTENVTFYNSSLENFNSREKFDLIVMLTVFEHLSNPKKSLKQVFSLLKKDGIIYLTAPNKYWLFEQHYGLPFLSWLPLPIANIYLKIFRGVPSYEDSSYSLGYGDMRKFFDKYKVKYDFILPFNEDSAFIGCGQKNSIYPFIRALGIKLIKSHPFFWNFSKGFIMVISHKNSLR